VEVAEGWRRLYKEELHNLHASSNMIRVIKSMGIRWVGHVTCMGKMINGYKILVGTLEEIRPLGSPSHIGGSRLNHGELWQEGVDTIHVAQDRDQRQAFVNVNEPSGSIKGRELLD
jgi:hypothetical protein